MALYWRFSGILLVLACAPSYALDGIRIVNEGGIRDEWMLVPGTTLATPVYPVAYASGHKQACAAIGYLINADGSTSDFALLKSWSSASVPSRSQQEYWTAFAHASAQALQQWRFLPRPEVKKPRPVYTVATMMFAATSPELRECCKVLDLTARLKELRRESGSRRHPNSALFDRLGLELSDIAREQLDNQRR